jgi:chemotaxis family two-component system response regulator Rcp1
VTSSRPSRLAAWQASSKQPDRAMQKRTHILVVEDNHPDVFLIRKALAAANVNASIHVTNDGEAAVAFFDAADADDNAPCPDVVLLDRNLPRKSGDEVLRHIRASRRCGRSKVIFVTSSPTALPKGLPDPNAPAADLYFFKPCDFAQFMTIGPIVRTLLESGSDPNRGI